MEQPIEIFCCTATQDQRYLEKIQQHLSQSVRKGIVTLWDESMIPTGWPRDPVIEQHLKSASIFLLLISADFLASEYCYEKVTKEALARQIAGNAVVIPVIVRAADWKTSILQGIQVLPRDLKPIHEHDAREQGSLINQVAQEIVRIIQSFSSSKLGSSTSNAPALVATVAPSPNHIPFGSPPPRSPSGPRPSLSRRTVILLIVVAIIVIGGAVFVSSIVVHQNQSNAQATATAQASLTNTAQAQLIATQQANATATQQAIQANAAASATATSPSVLITSPADGSTVSIVTVVQGAASNIPKDEELWLFIVPSNQASYFPQPGPIKISGGKWNIGAHFGGVSDVGLKFMLIPVLINQNDQEAHNALKKYFQQPGPVYQGIQQTSGMQLLPGITVVRV